MAHFAHITNGTVDSVIVISQETLDANNGWYCPACRVKCPASEWIQTSYNTFGGEHKLGGTPLRKNYAGVGFKYDRVRDAFIEPKPFESWLLDEQKGQWYPPKPRPTKLADNEAAKWNEEKVDWDIIHNIRCACGECGNDPTKMICPVYESLRQR